MSFFVRVFSQAEDFPSLNALCEELVEAGFDFSTAPGKDEPDFGIDEWQHIFLQYHPDNEPIKLERNTREIGSSVFKEELKEFSDAVAELPYSKKQKEAQKIFKYAVQIYAFEVEEDITEEGWDFLECLLDFLCDATDGYVQVDEEGLYDRDGALLLEIL